MSVTIEHKKVRETLKVLVVKDNSIVHTFTETVKCGAVDTFNNPNFSRHLIRQWFTKVLERLFGSHHYRGEGNPFDGIVIFNEAGEIIFRETYKRYLEIKETDRLSTIET